MTFTQAGSQRTTGPTAPAALLTSALGTERKPGGGREDPAGAAIVLLTFTTLAAHSRQDSLTASTLFLQPGKQCHQANVVSQAVRQTSGRQSSGRAQPPQPCLAHQRRRSPGTAARYPSFARGFNQNYSVV